MAVRPRFDPKRPLVAARDFIFMGKAYKAGDPFNPEGASDRQRSAQYEARAVNFGEGEATASSDATVEQVTMEGPKGGRYTISAPWLDEPEVVRGKQPAEQRLAELREAGPPLGFIVGGSAVTVEEKGGGWYEVNAPWLDEPEKVQGREAAEAKQREIHDAGEPDSYNGFTLTEGENGWWKITRSDDEAEEPVTLNVQGEEKARAAIATLRSGEMIEGQPVEWNPEPAPAVGDEVILPESAGDHAGQRGTVDSIDGEDAIVNVTIDDDHFEAVTVPVTELTAAPPSEGDTQPPAGTEGEGGASEETPPAEETGGATEEENDVTDKPDENERKPEDGEKPNEPGTNQPNGEEVINDHKVADGTAAEENGDDDGEGGDGTTGTVGP